MPTYLHASHDSAQAFCHAILQPLVQVQECLGLSQAEQAVEELPMQIVLSFSEILVEMND